MDSSDAENFVVMSPEKSTMRIQYLMICSKVSMTKFPTSETFAETVVISLTLSGEVAVQYWACCFEEHENTTGQHYHMCVKSSEPGRC